MLSQHSHLPEITHLVPILLTSLSFRLTTLPVSIQLQEGMILVLSPYPSVSGHCRIFRTIPSVHHQLQSRAKDKFGRLHFKVRGAQDTNVSVATMESMDCVTDTMAKDCCVSKHHIYTYRCWLSLSFATTWTIRVVYEMDNVVV